MSEQGVSVESKPETWKKYSEMLRIDTIELRWWTFFTNRLFQPTDPSSLAVVRILFGLLMVIDTVEERGLSNAHLRWGDDRECRFPLFDFLRPLPFEWMCMLYLSMILGSLGLAAGAHYRLSCLLHIVPYWYIIILDKSAWNNHSYLFGILGLIFLFSDANCYWSYDSHCGRVNKYGSIPLWNYAILRFQIFLLYFYAGLKKIDSDWLTGKSMSNMATHWVFDPMRFFLTTEQIGLWIVHVFGFLLDLTSGFFLYFDYTRPVASVFVATFHIMNAQMFYIGMFPYVCLATIPLFYANDWPKKCIRKWTGESSVVGAVPDENGKQKSAPQPGSVKRNAIALGLIIHVCLQLLLPFSHSITKGYNTWTNGLYGYSWDMMVHSWTPTLTTIKIVNQDNGEEIYLMPSAWVSTDRWAKHADMVIQYAQCLKRNIDSERSEIKNYTINIDVWMSLNGRFQQRIYDPNVDMLRANWDPFRQSLWVRPLLAELSDRREEMTRIENEVFSWSNHSEVLFIADFPGLVLENYIHPDLENVSLVVLEGEITYEAEGVEAALVQGERTPVTPGSIHKVRTTSIAPSTYMYTYSNTTEPDNSAPVHDHSCLSYVEECLHKKYESFSRAAGFLSDAFFILLFTGSA